MHSQSNTSLIRIREIENRLITLDGTPVDTDSTPPFIVNVTDFSNSINPIPSELSLEQEIQNLSTSGYRLVAINQLSPTVTDYFFEKILT